MPHPQHRRHFDVRPHSMDPGVGCTNTTVFPKLAHCGLHKTTLRCQNMSILPTVLCAVGQCVPLRLLVTCAHSPVVSVNFAQRCAGCNPPLRSSAGHSVASAFRLTACRRRYRDAQKPTPHSHASPFHSVATDAHAKIQLSFACGVSAAAATPVASHDPYNAPPLEALCARLVWRLTQSIALQHQIVQLLHVPDANVLAVTSAITQDCRVTSHLRVTSSLRRLSGCDAADWTGL